MHDWESIVREHGRVVWATAWRLLGREGDVHECFQETFLAAAQVAERESVGNWPALLNRIATVQSLQLIRNRQRFRARELSAKDAPDEFESTGATPQRIVEESEEHERLRSAIAALPENLAEVVLLQYFADMSYEEIARHCGVTVNHVGVLLHRARALLKRELGDETQRCG